MEGELPDHLAVKVHLEEICAWLGEDDLVDVGLHVRRLGLIIEGKIHLGRLDHYHGAGRIEDLDLLNVEPFTLGPGCQDAELGIGNGVFWDKDIGKYSVADQFTFHRRDYCIAEYEASESRFHICPLFGKNKFLHYSIHLKNILLYLKKQDGNFYWRRKSYNKGIGTGEITCSASGIHYTKEGK